MPTLKNAGPDPANPEDVVSYDYVTSLKAQDISSSAVDSQINSGYSGYANTTYVDAQDALNANKAYIDAGDAGRIALSSKDATNGVAGLQANGRVLPGKINLSNNQRWPRAFWSPSAYNAANVDVTTETTVYSVPITDPGYAYRIMCFGQVDGAVSGGGEYPILTVRAGNAATGEIVSRGAGMSMSYLTSTGLIGGDDFERTASTIGSGWTFTYSNPGNGSLSVDGHQTVWTPAGSSTSFITAIRSQPLDNVTQTDDQRCTMVFGDTGLPGAFFFAQDAENSIILRSSATSYVRAAIRENAVSFSYSTNGTSESPLGGAASSSLGTNPNTAWEFTAINRTFTLSANGTQILQVVDTTNVTTKGSSNRGWGFQLMAGSTNSGSQQVPAKIASIIIEDAAQEYASSQVAIIPVNLDSQTIKTGSTTVYLRLSRSGTTSVVRASPIMPSLWVSVIPA